MPDVYTAVTEMDASILEHLVEVLELRAKEPQQREMLKTYLLDASIPQGARVLEIGCGAGAVSRVLAAWPGVAEVIGVDPSPVFVAKARELAAGQSALAFQEADGRSLPFASALSFIRSFAMRPSRLRCSERGCAYSARGAA